MRIGPLGFWELFVILIVILLIFGRSRLPRLAKSFKESIREFRQEAPQTQDDSAPAETREREGRDKDTTRALKDDLKDKTS